MPYCTSVCDARSSGELMGVTMRSTVRKAARLAVYEEIRIRVKNHHTLPTMRPDIDLKIHHKMGFDICNWHALLSKNHYVALGAFQSTENHNFHPPFKMCNFKRADGLIGLVFNIRLVNGEKL